MEDCPFNLIQLCAGGDVGVYHEAVELLHALFMVDGGDNHAAGINAHHLPGRQIGDGNEGLAHQLLRLVGIVDTAEDDPVTAGAVVQGKLQKLLGLLHRLAGLDLHRPEVGLGEGFKVHKLGEQRLNFHLGEVDGSHRNERCFAGLHRRSGGSLFFTLGSLVPGDFLGGGLHGRDFRDQP